MPDFEGAVERDGSASADQEPAEDLRILAMAIDIGSTLLPDREGYHHAALSFRFVGPRGACPEIVLVLPDDELLSMPDALRRIIREARDNAADANTAADALREASGG